MNRPTILFLCAYAAVFGSCAVPQENIEAAATVEHHHIRCVDEDGTIMVDTTDVVAAPTIGASSWSWTGAGKDSTWISVPPYACLYRSWRGDEDPAPLVKDATPLPAEKAEAENPEQ